MTRWFSRRSTVLPKDIIESGAHDTTMCTSRAADGVVYRLMLSETLSTTIPTRMRLLSLADRSHVSQGIKTYIPRYTRVTLMSCRTLCVYSVAWYLLWPTRSYIPVSNGNDSLSKMSFGVPFKRDTAFLLAQTLLAYVYLKGLCKFTMIE